VDYYGLVKMLYRLAWIMVLASALFYVVLRDRAVRPYTGAFQGLFGNPNTLGMVFAVLSPVCVARFFVKKGILAAALPFIMAAMVLMSQSRAGLVGAFFGVATFLACYYGKNVWIAAGIVLLLMLPYTALQQGPSMFDQAEQDFMRGEASISQFGSGRYALWMMAFERFKDRPFTGYGFGTGGDVYLPSGEPFRYHSSFSQIAVELGIVGLIYFALPMIYAGVLVAKYHFVTVGNAHARAVIGGLMGAWLGGAMNSFFESWLFSVGNIAALLAWTCFAAGVKAMSEAKILGLEVLDEKRR
jgi:O-antigen ligase